MQDPDGLPGLLETPMAVGTGLAPGRGGAAEPSAHGRRAPCAPQVPVNLLRAGRIFVFEPPPGVKANMLRTFSSIPVSRICKVSAAELSGWGAPS